MTITEICSASATVLVVLDPYGRSTVFASVPPEARVAMVFALDGLAHKLAAAVNADERRDLGLRGLA